MKVITTQGIFEMVVVVKLYFLYGPVSDQNLQFLYSTNS